MELSLTIWEVLGRAIPECFLIMFGMYVFSKITFDKKKYMLSSVLLTIAVYLIRLFPINYGVHTTLNLAALIFISFKINAIDISYAVRNAVLMVILLFISEGINILMLKQFLHIDIARIVSDPYIKIFYGIPSLIIFGLIILIFRQISKKKYAINS